MAAYAALCSLTHIVEHLQHHPRPPISLDQQQAQSLTEIVEFLQEFLEGYSHLRGYTREADPLESRIADAAHAAEDVIESHIVDRIHAGSTGHGVNISSVDFYQGLREVIEDMDSIKKEAMEVKEKVGVRDHQLHRNSITSAGSSRPSSTWQNTTVGIDDALIEILDNLTGGDPGRRVIPIVGMGGMGKTTLARHVYVNPLVQQYFDICAWAVISQEYNAREIVREILCPGNKEELSDIEELGEKLHKHFSGMRYLIVLDDMWSIEAWEDVRRFFPDNSNGSRIVITTRLSNLASQLSSSYCLEMKFLDEDNSWNLLRKTVFGEEVCPAELKQIGKRIAKNCRGLPLSIVVTGGLLVKSEHSREYWAYIAENLNSLVNSEDDERCLNILYMSYKQMPVYLKPCFLYIGVFSEDSWIWSNTLIRLWVAEGFLKPISGRCLEEIAEEFLKELIDRNLVFASSRAGKIKECSLHDLLRDLCLREAEKERFYSVRKEHRSNDSKAHNTERRCVVPRSKFWNCLREAQKERLYSVRKEHRPNETKAHNTDGLCVVPQRKFWNCFREAQKERFYSVRKEHRSNETKAHDTERRSDVRRRKFWKEVSDDLQSKSLVRSLTWEGGVLCEGGVDPLLLNCRLLRVLHTYYKYKQYSENCSSLENMLGFVNLRFLAIQVSQSYKFPSSVCLLWNLQTLVIYPGGGFTAPPEIWMMPQLRHIKFFFGLHLPDPPVDINNNDVVLTNLQSLSTIRNFKCSEEVIKRIPNLKRLKIKYDNVGGSSDYCLNNLDRLHKLESFYYPSYSSQKPEETEFLHKLSFPHSLKKLTLNVSSSSLWDEMMEKIGSLPLLEVLKLRGGSIRVWETVEDRFINLKFLSVSMLKDLEHWISESTHFPCLEQLVLEYLHELKEIPSGIGEIPTLQSIEVESCSFSSSISAIKILEQLEEFGDVTLQVRVYHANEEAAKELGSLAIPNFQFRQFRSVDKRSVFRE